MVCSVDGCNKPLHCTGMCSVHYNRKRTTGTTDPPPRARLPLAERLWRQIDRRGPSECWPWISKSNSEGYGLIGLGGRGSGKELSHRLVWRLTFGEIPESEGYHGTVIRHHCNNRACNNPAHLMLGSQADNVADMWAQKTKPRGNARLTEMQVAAIRIDPRSSRQLAPIYGVSDAHIRSIRQGRAWKIKKEL